jgi:ring-1,2-phenylacetyl-CoA epoxidase subunit PaaD
VLRDSRDAIAQRLREFADEVSVDVSFTEPWTTERITADGRAALRAAGFAPPSEDPVTQCPYCGSRNTRMDNAFGPTLCRAIYYCSACRQPFEQFKLV